MYSSFTPYELENVLASVVNPSIINTQDNGTTAFFKKYLFEKAISVFKWTLPDGWDKDYFLYILYAQGYIAVINTPEFGVVPQRCTISGYNMYYAPKYAQISNPLIKSNDSGRYEIGATCELIKLQGNFTGIYDLVCYYAGKMALATSAIETNLVNAKVSKIFACKDRAAAESFKKMMDKVATGEPAVFIDKNLFGEDGKALWIDFDTHLKENYIVHDLFLDLRKFENEFCTELGIPNTNTDKRERLTTDEVNSNNVETVIRAELWLERLKECCRRVNKMFADRIEREISVDWRYRPNESNAVNSLSVTV